MATNASRKPDATSGVNPTIRAEAPTRTDALHAMTKAQLIALAGEHNITGIKQTMRKADLIELIEGSVP